MAEGSKRRVQIQRGDAAGIAIFVISKRVDCVRRAVREHFRRLEGGIWKNSRIVWDHLREVGWTSRLEAN